MVIVLVVERVHWKKYFFSYFFVADGSLNVSANFWQKKAISNLLVPTVCIVFRFKVYVLGTCRTTGTPNYVELLHVRVQVYYYKLLHLFH